MPQPLFLHIRARTRGATRVVAIDKDVVRIGRGLDCDARLDDPSIAEVECFLRRSGETWHVQPLSDRARLTIDGRPVTHLRAIAVGVSLRVGDTVLVLRDSANVPSEFRPVEIRNLGDPVAAPLVHPSVEDEDRRLGDAVYPDPLRARESAASRATARASFAQAMSPTGRVASAPLPKRGSETSKATSPPRRRIASAETLWEARWRAVGRSIQAQAASPRVVSQVVDAASDPQPVIVPFVARSEPKIFVEPIEPDLSTSEVKVHCPDSTESVATTITEVFPFEFPRTFLEAPAAPEPIGREMAEPDLPRREPIADELNRLPRPEHPLAPTREFDDHEWPSVSAILASCPPRPTIVSTASRATRRLPKPTEASEPAHWSPPRFLMSLTGATAIFVVGALGVFLAFQWGKDDAEAGALADRLLSPQRKAGEIIAESDINPDGTWWRTTAPHLAIRAAALDSGKGETSRDESAKFLLETARTVAPLEPSTRLTRADLAVRSGSGDVPLVALGLSRDTLSLAITARALTKAGKTDAGLAAYKSALELAVKSEISRGLSPVLADDTESKRFALPCETLVLGVIREMAGQSGWTYATWSPALPDHGLVWLCTYRVLKERNAPESETALAKLVDSASTPATGLLPLHQAAKAEGMAIRGRGDEANTLYGDAIAAMPESTVSRTWHLNRALILARSGEGDKAKEAVIAAQAGRGDDEIGRKVAQAAALEGIGAKPGQIPIKSN